MYDVNRSWRVWVLRVSWRNLARRLYTTAARCPSRRLCSRECPLCPTRARRLCSSTATWTCSLLLSSALPFTICLTLLSLYYYELHSNAFFHNFFFFISAIYYRFTYLYICILLICIFHNSSLRLIHCIRCSSRLQLICLLCDVQKDGWDTEPFELTERDGKLVGRGASDDKGPAAGWLNCLQAFREANVALPVNLKVTFTYFSLFSLSLSLDVLFTLWVCCRLIM